MSEFGNATIHADLERIAVSSADKARTEFVSKLVNFGAVRGSMLGPDWCVVYTIDGARDVRLADLVAGNFGESKE